MTGAIHGQLDGIAADSNALQAICDEQGTLMNSLGSTLEGLTVTLQGSAGRSMQQLGAQMHQEGSLIATQFADHSSKMANNANIMDSGDTDNAHLLSQVGSLVV